MFCFSFFHTKFLFFNSSEFIFYILMEKLYTPYRRHSQNRTPFSIDNSTKVLSNEIVDNFIQIVVIKFLFNAFITFVENRHRCDVSSFEQMNELERNRNQQKTLIIFVMMISWLYYI
jgi:hypothetical protein